MIKRIACLVLFLLSVANPWARANVRLKEAVGKALEMSREVLDQQLGAEASRLRRGEITARRTYTLDLGGSLAYASDSPHLRVGDVPWLQDALAEDVPADSHLFTAPRAIFDIRLSLNFSIFAGGALKQAAKAEDLAGLAEEDMRRAVEARLAAEVKGSFLRYRIFRETKAAAELFRQSLEHHQRKIESYLEAGLIRKSDVVETRSKIEEVALSILDLDRQIDEAGFRFRALCGLSPDEVEAEAEEDVPDVDTVLGIVKASHPFLKYIDQKLAQADALRLLAASAAKPRVSSFAQLHYGRPGVNFLADKPGLFVLGGLNIDVPLLDAKKSETAAALAGIEGRKLENRRAEFLRESEQEIRKLYALKAGLAAKAATIERMIELAAEDLRLKTRQYEEQQLSNLDCLAAMAQLEKCRSMRKETEFQREAVKVQIRAFLGAGKEAS